MASMIFVMIAIGGYTRLSGSGLSMVDWKPVTGWLPPLSESEWLASFASYRESPEYKLVNRLMNIEGFKSIFWAEYIHRLFGRLLGIVFFIPFVLLALKGHLKNRVRLYLLIGCMGGGQGVLGWWMVKSGLVNVPEVSAYRLCAHLLMASLLYTICLSRIPVEMGAQGRPSRLYWLCLVVLLIQLCSGAFVSGTEAGHAFVALWASFGSHLWLPELGVFNLFDNIFIIMTHHVTIGVLLTALYLTHIYRQWRRGQHQVVWILLALCLQVTLGLLTAFHYSPERPLWLSLAHQTGAFLLLTSFVLVSSSGDKGRPAN